MEMIQVVTWEGQFSTNHKIQALRTEMWDGQKIRDDANDANIKELVEERESSDGRLILQAN